MVTWVVHMSDKPCLIFLYSFIYHFAPFYILLIILVLLFQIPLTQFFFIRKIYLKRNFSVTFSTDVYVVKFEEIFMVHD